jgi:hypothetical protein
VSDSKAFTKAAEENGSEGNLDRGCWNKVVAVSMKMGEIPWRRDE